MCAIMCAIRIVHLNDTVHVSIKLSQNPHCFAKQDDLHIADNQIGQSEHTYEKLLNDVIKIKIV